MRMKWTGRLLSLVTAVCLLIPAMSGTVEASAPRGFNPEQIRTAYGIDKLPFNGAGQTIAIIAAFDYPNAAADLAAYNNYFGIQQMNGLPGQPACTADAGPNPCFEVVKVESANQNGVLYWSGNTTWQKEAAADVQWAHTIAPGADILLVLAKTDQLPDMIKAVDQAVAMGASVVSMSWGIPEKPEYTELNSHFDIPGVMFVAASGDRGKAMLYPATAPNVLSVGGTYLNMEYDGTYRSETVYNNRVGGSVGGVSQYQPAPAYQQALGRVNRSGPDVAWAAGFNGFPTYVNGKWVALGGTSLGAAQWAGMIALVNQANGGRFTDIGRIYAAAADDANRYFNDVTKGVGACQTSDCSAGVGYDLATGLGSPKADTLVYYLAGLPQPVNSAPPATVAATCAKLACATEFTGIVEGSASDRNGTYVKTTLTGGTRYHFDLAMTGATGVLIYDENGKYLTVFAKGQAGKTGYSWTAPADGTYYLKVFALKEPVQFTLVVK
ncbi:MAG: S53 family peptidase [Bacillota bacterium]